MKDTSFLFRGQLKTLHFPCVMGILNLTDDSFYSGSRISNQKVLISTATKMLSEGALILDIGAMSTRPGSAPVAADVEKKKIIESLNSLRREFSEVLISVDTFRSGIAEVASAEGADFINDISGGTMDPLMFDVVGKARIPMMLMHIQGTPETMQLHPTYSNVVNEVIAFLAKQIHKANIAGIHDVIIDPGFGFGKTTEHNYELLDKLKLLCGLHVPILVGLSRKSMIYKTLETLPEQSLNGTSALHAIALQNGADILRVHDVREAVEVIQLFRKLRPQH